MSNEYEKDLEINKFALDSECVDQARRYMKYSEQLADATADRDRQAQELKVTEAQVEQKVRTNPGVYGIEKITEAAVKSAVILSQEVRKAQEALNQYEYHVNVLWAAKSALEQRRAMLENLVKLFLSGYWADPKIGSEAGAKMSDQGSERQRQSLNQSSRLQRRKA